MAARIPPLLEPYLCLPREDALILLTNVLGATTNWLVLLYIQSILVPPSEVDPGVETKIVLVSFLRDFGFWSEGARRLGLDLSKLISQKRFMFVDGLSELFLPVSTNRVTEGFGLLRGTELKNISEDILAATERIAGTIGNRADTKKPVLVIDGLDLLLAAGGEDVSLVGMGEMLLDLREQVHATVVALSDDSPLALRQQTPLEINHASFLTSVAHQADLIIGLRLLDTGRARDVSGVIRINVQKVHEERDTLSKMEGKELLYFVGGDGSVRVFERGQ